MSNGKGDTARPLSVPRADFEQAWTRTFGTPTPVTIRPTPPAPQEPDDRPDTD